MIFYTTSEFARLVGVTKNTIVNWETRGWLLPHHVSPSGRRFYSQEQLEDYFAGKLGRKAGSSGEDQGGSEYVGFKD